MRTFAAIMLTFILALTAFAVAAPVLGQGPAVPSTIASSFRHYDVKVVDPTLTKGSLDTGRITLTFFGTPYDLSVHPASFGATPGTATWTADGALVVHPPAFQN